MRLIVTGDKSRYQFFRNMISEIIGSQDNFFTEKLGESDIYLTSNKCEVTECVYYSEKVPLNTIVFFPKEYGDLSFNYESTDRVIVFDEFPYATDDDIENLEKILSLGKYGQIEVVIFKNDRASLESDISTDEMAICEAKDRYGKMDISVYTYGINDRPDFLVWTSLQKTTCGKQVFQPIIRKVRNDISTFDSVYECSFDISDLSSLIDFDVLASFIEFENKMKGKNVWEIYYARSFDYYWKNNARVDMFYTELYKETIVDLCAWNLEHDIKTLGDFIRKQYAQEFATFKPLVFNEEKDKYDEFLNIHKKEVLDFKLKVKDFFTVKLKYILKKRISRNVERMEELMR